MASATAAASISPTAQAASTFITSTITTPTSTQTSATSTTASASATASSTSKSSSPWDNLNLLLIFVPLVLIFIILGLVYYGGRWFPKLWLNSWKLKKAFRDGWNWFLALCYSLVNFLFYRSARQPKESSKDPSVSAWVRATQGVQNIVVNAKSTTANAATGLRSISLPSWPSFPARKPKRPVITHHFDLPPPPEKHNTPPFTTLPEDPFPDTSTVASLSIVEEPEVLGTPDAVYISRQ